MWKVFHHQMCQNKVSVRWKKAKLESIFSISVNTDDPTKHPEYFCHACKRVMDKAGSRGNYQHRTVIFGGWSRHSGLDCTVCRQYAHAKRVERLPKVVKTPGRPSTTSPRYLVQHIQDIAPTPLVEAGDDTKVCRSHLSVPFSEFKCPLCNDLLRSPIELVTCGKIVCVCNDLLQQDSLQCPCCRGNHLSDFKTQAGFQVGVECPGEHLYSVCEMSGPHSVAVIQGPQRKHTNPQEQPGVQPQSSIVDILHQPLTAQIEEMLQTNLAKRSLSSSGSEVLHLRTGGKVNISYANTSPPLTRLLRHHLLFSHWPLCKWGMPKSPHASPSPEFTSHESWPQHSLEQAKDDKNVN